MERGTTTLNDTMPGSVPGMPEPPTDAGQTPGAQDHHLDDGAGQWRTVAEAAAILGVHPRTVERRANAGRLQKRTVDGSPQVWVPDGELPGNAGHMPGAVPGDLPTITEAIDAMSDQGQRQMVLASGAITGWKQAADQAQAEVIRSKRTSVALAGALAVLVVAGGVGLWWGTRAVTTEQAHKDTLTARLEASSVRVRELADQVAAERQGAEVRIEALNDRLRQASSQADVMAFQLDRAMTDLEQARAERDALEAKQTATVATWAAPEAVVEQGGDEEPAPGG